jgi:hypothetical protein
MSSISFGVVWNKPAITQSNEEMKTKVTEKTPSIPLEGLLEYRYGGYGSYSGCPIHAGVRRVSIPVRSQEVEQVRAAEETSNNENIDTAASEVVDSKSVGESVPQVNLDLVPIHSGQRKTAPHWSDVEAGSKVSEEVSGNEFDFSRLIQGTKLHLSDSCRVISSKFIGPGPF